MLKQGFGQSRYFRLDLGKTKGSVMGYRPVIQTARVGIQMAIVTWPCSKRNPRGRACRYWGSFP